MQLLALILASAALTAFASPTVVQVSSDLIHDGANGGVEHLKRLNAKESDWLHIGGGVISQGRPHQGGNTQGGPGQGGYYKRSEEEALEERHNQGGHNSHGPSHGGHHQGGHYKRTESDELD